MTSIPRILAVALFTAALTLASNARAADYTLDSAHAAASFQISHLGFSQTHGGFKEIAGSFSFDPAKPETASVEVTIVNGGQEVQQVAV